MKRPQLGSAIGKNCRSSPAGFAGNRHAPAAAAPVIQSARRIPLFAQFPPAALFAAIGRAMSRSQRRAQIANGMGLARGRLRRPAGGP